MIMVYITRKQETELIDTSVWDQQTQTLQNKQLETNTNLADPRLKILTDISHYISRCITSGYKITLEIDTNKSLPTSKCPVSTHEQISTKPTL